MEYDNIIAYATMGYNEGIRMRLNHETQLIKISPATLDYNVISSMGQWD
jgi:hypothetical protein